MGVEFELLLPDADEDAESLEHILASEDALTYVRRVTLAKLDAAIKRRISRKAKEVPILCADTTVAIQVGHQDEILGKPKDDQDANRILQLLSGTAHWVHTAVAIHTQEQTSLKVSSSRVQFAKLSHAQIQAYIASGEPHGKAGAYGIQGIAACFIKSIEGSYSGIMGLPLYETSELLTSANVPFFFNPIR